jgi:hypothetical protein
LPFQLKLESKDPLLVILELEGQITAAEMREHLDALSDLLQQEGMMDEVLYLLIDARKVNMNFPDVIAGSKVHGTKRRGTAADPKTNGVFISHDQMVQLLRDLLAKHAPEAYTPIFSDYDEAHTYILELAAIQKKQR